MKNNEDENLLLNEMAVYKTELSNGSVENQFQRIHNIIKNLSNVNQACSNGMTYLTIAVCQYKFDIIELLLKNGADPNIGDNAEIYPLIYAFLKSGHNNCDKIVHLLLKYGADPSLCSKAGQTAFDVALLVRADQQVIMLLEEANIKLHGRPHGL